MSAPPVTVARGDGWQTPSYCSACHQNHPGACGCPCHQPAAVNPVALYDALNCASAAALLAEDDSGDPGRARKAQEALWEAAVAAADVFPLGSPRSDALHVVLGAVSGLLRGTEVTA